MKKSLFCFACAFVFLLSMSSGVSAGWTGGHDVVGSPNPSQAYYFAEGCCRPEFETYFCIFDAGGSTQRTEPNVVTLTYYKGDGTTATDKVTTAPLSRVTVNPRNTLGTGNDPGHDFSTLVRSTYPVIVERPMYFSYKGVWTGGHDVMGSYSTGSTFYFAEGTCRPGFETYFCVFNSGESMAQVKIEYMKGDGTQQEQSVSVSGKTRSTVFVNDILGVGDDPAHDFSAKVSTTSGGLVVERPMYFDHKGWTGGHDVVGEQPMPGPIDVVCLRYTYYLAEGSCRPGFDPYICIQNPGTADASITVTYYKGDGSTRTQDMVVPKLSRKTIRIIDVLGVADDTAHDFSAKVDCTNNKGILVERPVYFNYQGRGRHGWTGGSDVMGSTRIDSGWLFAEGTCRPGFDTYFCLQNPGSADAAVDLKYNKGDGTSQIQSVLVPAHSRVTIFVNDFLGTADDDGHDFATEVKCSNSQNILVERPMYFDYTKK
jgi:hypothetical protein